MELYFLRHGLAGQHGNPKYKDDSLRPLTEEGREKIHRTAQGMQVLGLNFDSIISSPYLRARQTAETVALAYKIKPKDIHLTDNLLPPATVESLLKETSALFPKSKKILLVGHEPHLSEMVSSLLGYAYSLNIDFKKGGLCSLTLDRGVAALNWLLTPAQLVLIGSRPIKAKDKR